MKTIAIILTTLLALQLFAQETTIKGYIHDAEENDAFVGATVLVKGTAKGVLTNALGQYTISANNGDTLEFRFVGYETIDVIFDNTAEPGLTELVFTKKEMRKFSFVKTFKTSNNTINLTMSLDSYQMEVIDIVDYSSRSRENESGAVDIVSGVDLAKRSTGSAISAIEGKLTGVKIQRNSGTPGGDASIQIRGISSLINSNPLYVIDGVPSNSMKALNPSDIASIAVLKDGSSCAIYGARGANGVILIQTKGGLKRMRNNEEVFFKGIKNEIHFQSWEDNTQSYEVHCSRGKIYKEGNCFIYEAKRLGEAHMEVIEKDKNGQIVNRSQIKCLIKKLPKPAANFAEKFKGTITLEALDSIPSEITLRYIRKIKDPMHTVVGFSLSINNETPLISNSNMLTEEQKKLIMNVKVGDQIRVSNIKIENDKGRVSTTAKVKLKVI